MKTSALTISALSFITGAMAAPVVKNNVQTGKKLNVLYIMTDQQSYDMIHAISGNKYISTPNLDRLVNNGYAFANAYCASPLSMPSRFALVTGMAPAQFGARLNQGIPAVKEKILDYVGKYSMGALFRQAGYDTYYAGKVHLAFANGDNSVGETAPYKFEYLEKSERQQCVETSVKFIHERKSDKPFLFFISLINPHDICSDGYLISSNPDKKAAIKKADPKTEMGQTLLRYQKMVDSQDPAIFLSDERSVPLPANLAPTNNHPLSKVRTVKYTDAQWRKFIWVYHRLVELVDNEIGQILDALYASPYKDNTVIVFTSDHGELGGAHRTKAKNILYEECQKIPFVFYGPGIQHKIDRTAPVCNGWDLLPTLCDIAGIEKPQQLLGISLWDYITNGTPLPERKNLFLEQSNSYCILQDGRYKYIKYEDTRQTMGNPEVLFDLEKDPGEMHNLIDDKVYAFKLTELRLALDEELSRRGVVFNKFHKTKNQGYGIHDGSSDL